MSNFVVNTNIQEIAAAYTLDAIDVAKQNFKVVLDRTESSIQKVENILDILHRSLSKGSPSEETIMTFSKLFGSYIGEIYRQYHSAEWGLIEIEGESVVGLKNIQEEIIFWPWGRVYHRIINGEEENVWIYYQSLIKA